MRFGQEKFQGVVASVSGVHRGGDDDLQNDSVDP